MKSETQEHEHPYLAGIHSLELFSETKGSIQKLPLKKGSCFSMYIAFLWEVVARTLVLESPVSFFRRLKG